MNVVFHAGTLSEFMLLMPLLRAMQRPITVVAPWQRASIAARLIGAAPLDIELFEFTRLHAEQGPSRVSPAVRDLFSSAHQIISFLSAQDDAWARNVRRLAPGVKLLLVEPRPDASSAEHFTLWHRGELARQGLALTPTEPTTLSNPHGPILVHPGSSAIKRAWPVERYEALIRALRSRGRSVKPVFGEIELQRWSADRIAYWTDELQGEAFRSADALIPIMREAQQFIGNDAGPLHLAAQLGLPTLAILGPSDPSKTGQRGPNARHLGPINGPGRIEDVSLDAVMMAIG